MRGEKKLDELGGRRKEMSNVELEGVSVVCLAHGGA